jgi:predicted MFS family arabinose efflux permease
MYIALEAGIGSGALVAGWVFKDQWQRIPPIFYGSALVACMGLLYLLLAHTRPLK